MGFDHRDIYKTMDVYTFDNTYLGTVLKVVEGRVHAQEHVPPSAQQTSIVNGELLGPMPTHPLGNQASIKQGSGAQYDTIIDAASLGDGTMLVGRWWGLCGRHTIPLADVQTVSLERIVLTRREAEFEDAGPATSGPEA